MARHSYNSGAGWIEHYDGGVDVPQVYNTGGNGLTLSDKPIAPVTAVAVYADVAAPLTVGQVLGGIVTHAPASNRALTLPTAAALLAVVPGAVAGTTVDFLVVNTGASTSTATSPGASVTLAGAVAAQPATSSRLYRLRFTNVGVGTEAYTAYY